MRVTGITLDCFLYRKQDDIFADGVLTVGWEPDCMNNTVVNGHSEGPISLREGDAIKVEIPSGVWEGKIVSIDSDPNTWRIRVEDATWCGKYAGLRGGLSGFFWWKVVGVKGEVETSAYPSPVPFGVYSVAHVAADYKDDYYGRPEERREALRAIITFIMS